MTIVTNKLMIYKVIIRVLTTWVDYTHNEEPNHKVKNNEMNVNWMESRLT